MSEVRTIKGPCFDCDDANDFGCVCRFFPDSDLACPCHGSVRDTAPVAKVRPRNAAQRAAEDDVMQIKWTDERPTEPGEYWLTVHPDQRGEFGPQATWPQPITITFPDHEYPGSVCIFGLHYSPDSPKVAKILTSALWAPRETPADPFEVTE